MFVSLVPWEGAKLLSLFASVWSLQGDCAVSANCRILRSKLSTCDRWSQPDVGSSWSSQWETPKTANENRWQSAKSRHFYGYCGPFISVYNINSEPFNTIISVEQCSPSWNQCMHAVYVMLQYCELLEILDVGTRQSSACLKHKNHMQILAKSQVSEERLSFLVFKFILLKIRCFIIAPFISELVAWHIGRTLVFGWRTFPVACLTHTAAGWPLMWVNRPLEVNQPCQLSLSASRGR